MSHERFNRQFVLLDFKDLDNPEFLALVRSPEFSTYLLMRRYIWRSLTPHPMGLHDLYRAGFLACSLDREKISEHLGGVSTRTISTDLAALERREIITVRHTGRQNIYLLGRWGEDEGARYEIFYLDRLHVREEENFPSDVTRNELPIREEENFLSEVQIPAPINRERNTEENRDFEGSKGTLAKILEARRLIGRYIDDYARELRDDAPHASSVTRAVNLYLSSDLNLDDFVIAMMAARETTQRRSASIQKSSDRSNLNGMKNKMPYFFSVLQSLVRPDDATTKPDALSLNPRREQPGAD